MNSKPEWRSLTYLVAVSSSSSSFVTIHAQWANPPWLTRLTLRLPASVSSSPVHSSPPKRSLRSSADTITQSANDDDDSLLLNLTPLNCRTERRRSSEDEIPPRTQIAVRTISVGGTDGHGGAFSVTNTHKTQDEEREGETSKVFFAFSSRSLRLLFWPNSGRYPRAQVFTLSS